MAENTGLTNAFSSLVKGLQKIIDKVDQWIDWWIELIPRSIKAFVVMFKDLFLWALEQCLSLVKTAVDGIAGLDTMTAQIAGTWAGLPPDVVTVMQSIGLGTALGIIGTAIGIRLLLQLIPFTRLGS
ncbi:DUF2523 family protein [Acidovorax sp. NCPPB 4044]|uniref:DUF2523 family protein n=1 Tax=Acidovorax sp. NCPPB 4044 TaxID=2940490 RepID=UPI00230440B8|nr:DUF2523 family protein [Acidovorax sp. NCPPB 4044]MDA8521359.1 DUF2523 domain-containing protein [Acidovorax sp. NCPPB 4044]